MQDDCQRRRDWSDKSRNAVIWFFLAGQSDAQRWAHGAHCGFRLGGRFGGRVVTR
jgi:hypothetical protein